jgi:hypothetical protein
VGFPTFGQTTDFAANPGPPNALGLVSGEARSFNTLRNVVANYPFEKSRRFCGDRAEFWPWRPLAFELQHRRYAARGRVLSGSSANALHGRWPSFGVAEKARIGRDLFRSEDDPPVAKGLGGRRRHWRRHPAVLLHGSHHRRPRQPSGDRRGWILLSFLEGVISSVADPTVARISSLVLMSAVLLLRPQGLFKGLTR